MKRTIAATLALALLAACEQAGPPERTNVYEWRQVLPVNDTITFHWPRSALPVRYWVADEANMPARVERALAIWKTAFLYDEFDGRLVDDSATADVIVRGVPAPDEAGLLVSRLGGLLPECSGATDVIVSDDHTQIVLPIRVYVSSPLSPEASDHCFDLTTIHEIGHSMGIFRHSPDAADIMFANPSVVEPSERDRETMERAYHLAPTVTATPR